MILHIKCFVVLIILYTTVNECKYGFVTWSNGTAVVSVTDNYEDIPAVYVAKATYSNDINSTGWAFLELHTSPDVRDEKQAYAAGYLEGYLTRDLIWMHWQNVLKGYCYNKTEVCGLIEDYVDKNEDYIASMVAANPDDPYWYQIKLYYIQLEGLSVGYNQATDNAYEWLTFRDILWVNMLGDLDDLSFALSLPPETPDALLFGERCSGLVKLLPDWSELYTSQVTWNSYQSMLRFQKLYALHYRMSPSSSARIPGWKMAFTSYPAFVQSTDDFYIMSSGLVAAETTIGNSNRTLYENVKPVGQILEFVRAMVANRLSSGGRQWSDTFRRHNSGTYNNQWYIVDYQRFRPGVVGSDLLWVLEQLPGHVEAADITEQLKATTYHPSYNIAYFPSVFNLSGGNERVAAFGDWFGYHTHPRAKMFKLKQEGITSMESMFSVLRYNDYLHDPLAACDCRPPRSACNAIAARNDLNPINGTYPFRALGHRSHGATDAKLTSHALHAGLRFLAVAGPAHNISRGIPPFHHGATDAKLTSHALHAGLRFLAVAGPAHNISRGIPPFQWSRFDLGRHISHEGHPDLWVFPSVMHRWEWG